MAMGLSERFGSEEEEQMSLAFNNAAQLRVAIPGIIESFDADKQTASVQPAIKENIQVGDEKAKAETLPILSDVPVCFPRAGGYCVTLPVEKGNECLLVFADMCIDGWWQSGGVQEQMETRRHDLSDAIAIMGITSQPKKVEEYSKDKLQIRTDNKNVICEIDKEEQAVNIVKAKKLTANASEKIDVKCDGDITITAVGNIKIQGANASLG